MVYAGLDAIYARRLPPVLLTACGPFAHLARLTRSGLVVYPPQPRPGQVKITLIGREDDGVQIFTGAARPASMVKPR